MPLQATSGAASYDAFGGGVAAVPNYIEDVFSTYLYTGTGATQTINNGIDLSTKGGLVWFKNRGSASGNHWLFDSARNNFNNILLTNTTDAQLDVSSFPYDIDPTTSGFTVKGTAVHTNTSGNTYASWTFRKQPKFFDVQTFTYPLSGSITVNHNLQSTPGCVMVKVTDGADGWYVYHRMANNGTNPSNYILQLNTTGAQINNFASWITVGSTSITFPSGALNPGSNFVMYLFAHNAGGFGLTGTDNVISCGSYTGNGSATGPVVTLGYEPQWLLVKSSSSTWNWIVVDNMRGFPSSTSGMKGLNPNNSNAEFTESAGAIQPTSTGFTVNSTYASYNESGGTYIYIAIRRGPMRVPTSGTSVFSPLSRAGTSSLTTISSGSVGVVDTIMAMSRNVTNGMRAWDRLRGVTNWLGTYTTQAETAATGSVVGFDSMTGVRVNDGTNEVINTDSVASPYINYMFKRAPSFFDEVCYTGTGSARTINHNLGVAPELMIVKRRDNIDDWGVYAASYPSAATGYFKLNTTQVFNVQSGAWNNTAPTASVFTVGNNAMVNASGGTYVAYLFATCAGVSKVGSYTGTGTGNPQTIDCGFTAGARFVLIRKTSATGSWWVWDSARGIVASVDPYLALDQNFAEDFNGTSDSVDTHSTGFIVNENAQNNVNSGGATYIFLAIA